ncbi:50S ribosomal protein L13 [soil metagenome]
MGNAKTYSQKPTEVTRRWILVDASSAPLGRVATTISKYLIGKYKPTYTPHTDGGDYVVVINAAQVVVTGEKETDKRYYHHSGYPGSLRDESLSELRTKYPERIVIEAVKGMIPKNKLASDRMGRLRVFPGADHTHAPQTPEKVEVTF